MFGVEGLARSFVRGALVGGVGTFVVTAAIVYTASHLVVSSLAVAGFAAFWGGPGFGGMLGAVGAMTREEHRAGAETAFTGRAVGEVVPLDGGVSSAA